MEKSNRADQPPAQQQPSAMDLFRSFLNTREADPEDREAIMYSMFGQVLRGNLGNVNDFLPHPEILGAQPSVPIIPLKVFKILNAIDVTGSAGPNIQGETFQNREGKLPSTNAQGNAIEYKKRDVNPKQARVNREPQRLVTGSDGSAY